MLEDWFHTVHYTARYGSEGVRLIDADRMSKDVLTYMGYSTRPEYSIEDGIIFGKIEGISDLVSFECDSTAVEDVEAAFREAVDDYLEACRAVGKEPNKSYIWSSWQ